MEIQRTALPEVLLITPRVFHDQRGYFYESWNQQVFDEAVGRRVEFVQDNHSFSMRGALRGLHFQTPPHAQGKLVRVTSGRVFDVALDIRPNSSSYGQHVGIELDADKKQMLWVPEGFAHGFLVLSESANFLYKTTNFYHPESEGSYSWRDPLLDIAWPLDELDAEPELSDKDRAAPSFGVAVAQL